MNEVGWLRDRKEYLENIYLNLAREGKSDKKGQGYKNIRWELESHLVLFIYCMNEKNFQYHVRLIP